MEPFIITLLVTLTGVILCTALLMHLVHQERALLFLYLLQSLAVTTILLLFAWYDNLPGLLPVALLTLIVKVIIAPSVLQRLLRRQALSPTASRYLNLPLTLLALMLLVGFAYSQRLAPLAALSSAVPHTAPALLISSFLVSFFLLINRRGILSQIVGILSLENSIVAFGSLLGVEQSLSLELGIAFDIVLWVLIATFMASLIQRHFGTLESTALRQLSE